jgi:hypothetical protein
MASQVRPPRLLAAEPLRFSRVVKPHDLDAMRVRPHGNAGMGKFRLWIVHNESVDLRNSLMFRLRLWLREEAQEQVSHRTPEWCLCW